MCCACVGRASELFVALMLLSENFLGLLTSLTIFFEPSHYLFGHLLAYTPPSYIHPR